MRLPAVSLVATALLAVWMAPHVAGDEGVLHTDGRDFCLMFNPNFHALPSVLPPTDQWTTLINSLPSTACAEPAVKANGSVVLVSRGECDFAAKAHSVQGSGGTGVIVANSGPGAVAPGVANASDYEGLSLPVGMVSYGDAGQLSALIEAHNGRLPIALWAPPRLPPRHFDSANYVMLLLAAVIVSIGCLWAYPAPRRNGIQTRTGVAALYESVGEDLKIDVKFSILIFLVMSGVLVALYFLYRYLVYLVIGLFVLGGTSALTQVLHDLTSCLPSGPSLYLKWIGENVSVKVAIESVLALAVCIVWLVFRKESWAWVLQDIIGGALVCVLLLSLRLPSMKVGVLVLALFWVYDVFMTFITPLFMPHGDSIMVAVAMGQKEEMPMVLKLPHFETTYARELCGIKSYSLLGFGDLVIPGLFLCFLLRADRAYHPRLPTYFAAGILSYMLGLALTYVGMYFMRRAQPALLYINPVIAIFALIQTALRKETAALWHGDFKRVYAHAEMQQSDVMLTLQDPDSFNDDLE